MFQINNIGFPCRWAYNIQISIKSYVQFGLYVKIIVECGIVLKWGREQICVSKYLIGFLSSEGEI